MPNFYIADSEQELNEHNEQLAQIEQLNKQPTRSNHVEVFVMCFIDKL